MTVVCNDCDPPREFALPMHLGSHRKRAHGGQPVPGTGEPTGSPPSPDGDAGAGAYQADEQRPTVPQSTQDKPGGRVARLLFGDGEKDKDTTKAPRTREAKPRAPQRARVKTSEFWGDALSPISGVIGRAGYVPMARAMVWTSPVAGEIIEDATKGTVVDRVVQPWCRNAGKWQDLFDLLGFWAAIGAAQRNPAQAPQAMQFARSRLVNLLPRIAKNIRKQADQEREAVEALQEFMPDLAAMFPDAPPDVDPVTLLIQSLFAAPEGVPDGVET